MVFDVLRGILEVAIGVAAGSLGFFIQYFPSSDQEEIEKIIAASWDIFQPLVFRLIGAEVSIASRKPETVGLCVATLGNAVLIQILTTFLMVCFAGFNIKEKIFISSACLLKATVQTLKDVWDIMAKNTVRLIWYNKWNSFSLTAFPASTLLLVTLVGCNRIFGHSEVTWRETEEYRMDVLTVAFLSILITAPFGSLLTGLLGPWLLQKAEHQNENEVLQGETSEQVEM